MDSPVEPRAKRCMRDQARFEPLHKTNCTRQDLTPSEKRIDWFLTKVSRFFRRYPTDDSGLVLAVSGGPDSVALLRAVVKLCRRSVQPISHAAPLVVAHVNHLLRGSESDADERFVGQLCGELSEKYSVPLTYNSTRIDVPDTAARARANLEGTARRLRYDWLTEVAERHGIRLVATGHTADDQAETVLHNLLRGTGLRGLRGIAPRRPLKHPIELLRPLLDVGRSEVLSFLDSLGQSYRQDSSNADLRFVRNRLRHRVLPFLVEHGNRSMARTLARLAKQTRAAYEDSRALASILLGSAELPRAGSLVILDTATLAASPRTRIREMFREIWIREGWPRAAIGFREWNRLAGLALGEMPALDLPGGIRARYRQRVVQVGPVS
jgi:tRNA(Ile)-lysidine synthase